MGTNEVLANNLSDEETELFIPPLELEGCLTYKNKFTTKKQKRIAGSFRLHPATGDWCATGGPPTRRPSEESLAEKSAGGSYERQPIYDTLSRRVGLGEEGGLTERRVGECGQVWHQARSEQK